MSYQLYLTTLGAAKLTAAGTTATGVHLTQFVVGSGQAVDFSTRLDSQTLTTPVYQGAIESVSPTDTPNQYAVACVVPPSAGGFTISEVGLIDSDGTLIWVGSLPSVQKPDATSPAAVDYRINCLVSVDNYNGAVTLTIDPNVVTATRSWIQSHYFDQTQMTAQLDALNQQIAALLARPFEGIPLGGILTTTKDYKDSDAVTADLGYGHWIRYGKGMTLVGHDPAVTAGGSPAWWATLGNITGEFSHTLTVEEMPSHTHKVADTTGISGAGGGWDMNANASNFIESSGVQHTGGDKPHNNIQPSIVVAFWLRVNDLDATVPQLYSGTDASVLTHTVTPISTMPSSTTDSQTDSNTIATLSLDYYFYDMGDGLLAPSSRTTANSENLQVSNEGHADPDWVKSTIHIPAGITSASQVKLTTTSQYIHLDTSTLANGTVTVVASNDSYATRSQTGAFAEKATATLTFTA